MAKVGFTYDLRKDFPLKKGEPKDLNAEFDYVPTINRVKTAVERAGHKLVDIGNVNRLLKKLPNLKVDIVLNICEGIGSRNREAQVPMILETYGIPYIGSDGLTMSLTLDKIMTKKVLIADKIPTPRFMGINKLDDLADLDHMEFPLIIKLRQEGTSKGISDESVVHNKKELKKRAEFLFDRYKNSPLIIEEFIAGSEFTVAVIGNSPAEALPPIQVLINEKLDLGELIYTFDKINSGEIVYLCPAKISRNLEKKLVDLTLRTYKAVDCLDFGRVDFRVDKKGNPYVLEINPLPSLHIEDAYGISSVVAGFSFDKAVGKIIDAGLMRYGLI